MFFCIRINDSITYHCRSNGFLSFEVHFAYFHSYYLLYCMGKLHSNFKFLTKNNFSTSSAERKGRTWVQKTECFELLLQWGLSSVKLQMRLAAYLKRRFCLRSRLCLMDHASKFYLYTTIYAQFDASHFALVCCIAAVDLKRPRQL